MRSGKKVHKSLRDFKATPPGTIIDGDSPTIAGGAAIAASSSPLAIRRAAALVISNACGLRVAPAVNQTHGAKRYFISGMVQGVGYRWFAHRAALRLRVSGYVKNLRDGRVEVYAAGPAASLVALRAELERGPRGAVVSSVVEEDVPVDPRFTHEFSIEHDA